jgi:hypothetical protein
MRGLYEDIITAVFFLLILLPTIQLLDTETKQTITPYFLIASNSTVAETKTTDNSAEAWLKAQKMNGGGGERAAMRRGDKIETYHVLSLKNNMAHNQQKSKKSKNQQAKAKSNKQHHGIGLETICANTHHLSRRWLYLHPNPCIIVFTSIFWGVRTSFSRSYLQRCLQPIFASWELNLYGNQCHFEEINTRASS